MRSQVQQCCYILKNARDLQIYSFGIVVTTYDGDTHEVWKVIEYIWWSQYGWRLTFWSCHGWFSVETLFTRVGTFCTCQNLGGFYLALKCKYDIFGAGLDLESRFIPLRNRSGVSKSSEGRIMTLAVPEPY